MADFQMVQLKLITVQRHLVNQTAAPVSISFRTFLNRKERKLHIHTIVFIIEMIWLTDCSSEGVSELMWMIHHLSIIYIKLCDCKRRIFLKTYTGQRNLV